MSQVKCPKCAELIQKDAKVCRYCGAKFGGGLQAPVWLAFAGIAVFYYLGSLGEEKPASAPAPVAEPLTPQVRQQCGELISTALKSGVITKRPSPNRIEFADATWAQIDADTKRNTMSAVACDAFGKKMGDLRFDEFVVVYGSTSGKRLAMLTSVGINFD